MESFRRIFNREQIEREKVVGEVSGILPDLFGISLALPHITFATEKEIKEMHIRDGVLVGHNSSYVRSRNEIIIRKDSRVQDKKIELYRALAAELAHIYHKGLGDNTETLNFDFGWAVYTEFRRQGNYGELVLPQAMVENMCIPYAKREVSDGYCQTYVLRKLGRFKETDKVAEEHGKWHKIVALDMERINELELKAGDYNKVRELFARMIIECESAKMPLSEHPSFIIIKQYFNLGNSIGYWFSEVYIHRLGENVEEFRKFVRIPILPTTSEDIELFEQSLGGLNQHLRSKNLPTIAYGKK